jgi:peroxiredoxin Q/BCP
MKLQVNQQAPVFTTPDVYGQEISLQALRGKKVYLAFERNAGCPVCNLRTHELLKQADYFLAHGVAVLLIYESTVEKMKDYLADIQSPFHFIADPENRLYESYQIERSFLKVLKGLFHGLIGKAMAGKKLFRKPTAQDGNAGTIPSEFIIDEKGNLRAVHYGRYVGDMLALDVLKEKLK